MTTTIRAAALCLALIAGGALADGVPLITPGSAVAADANTSQQPGFVKLHGVNLNKGGFGANVLTVTIDSKEYRFVGAMTPQAPRKALEPTGAASSSPQAPLPRFASWVGKEPGGGAIGITKDLDSGNIDLIVQLPPSRVLRLEKRGAAMVLVEIDRSAAYAPPLLVPPASAASGVQK